MRLRLRVGPHWIGWLTGAARSSVYAVLRRLGLNRLRALEPREPVAGTIVTWTNNDALPHTVTSTKSDDVDGATSGLFDRGTLQTGESFSYTFTKAGDYPYDDAVPD